MPRSEVIPRPGQKFGSSFLQRRRGEQTQLSCACTGRSLSPFTPDFSSWPPAYLFWVWMILSPVLKLNHENCRDILYIWLNQTNVTYETLVRNAHGIPYTSITCVKFFGGEGTTSLWLGHGFASVSGGRCPGNVRIIRIPSYSSATHEWHDILLRSISTLLSGGSILSKLGTLLLGLTVGLQRYM